MSLWRQGLKDIEAKIEGEKRKKIILIELKAPIDSETETLIETGQRKEIRREGGNGVGLK